VCFQVDLWFYINIDFQNFWFEMYHFSMFALWLSLSASVEYYLYYINSVFPNKTLKGLAINRGNKTKFIFSYLHLSWVLALKYYVKINFGVIFTGYLFIKAELLYPAPLQKNSL